ncbi:MAG: nucleotidyltransferase [Desulfurococcaceae archaeon]
MKAVIIYQGVFNMGLTRRDLARIYRELVEEGVDGVLIGDTVVQLVLGFPELEGDIDLFVKSPSPLVEFDFYSELASRKNWEISTSELGIPRLIIPLEEQYVTVELYENFMDIEIPDEIVNKPDEIIVEGVRIKAIRPEHYIVLKARQGVDLDKLAHYINGLRKKGLNIKVIENAIETFPQEEQDLIRERLTQLGLIMA